MAVKAAKKSVGGEEEMTADELQSFMASDGTATVANACPMGS